MVRLVRLAPQESAAARGGLQERRPRGHPALPWCLVGAGALPTLAGVILVGSFIYYERFQIVRPRPSTAPARVVDQVAPAPELPTGPEAPQAPAPQVLAEVAPSRSGPLGEADKARAVGGTIVGRTTVGETTAAVASEEEQWQQQTEQDPKGNFAFYKAPTTAPVPAVPSPSFAPAPPSAPRSGADRLEHLESSAQHKLKKEAEPQALDDAVARGKPELRAGASVANELTNRGRAETAPKPSRSKELQKAAAEPKNAAKSVVAREGRLAERADVAEGAQEKETRQAGVGGRQYARAAGLEEGAGAATGLKARDAQTRGPFRKQIPAATHRLALTVSGQLLVAPAESNKWQPLTMPSEPSGPSGAAVTDFAVFGDHLWVLLPVGRVAHSANLGRSWDPVVETGAKDPATISFRNALAGEIQTRSGRRLRTTDGGQNWQPVQK